MSSFRDWWDGRGRRARAAEAEGRHRDAAALYASMGKPIEAARCLGHAGDRAEALEERLAAWLDALALLPPTAIEERESLETRIGCAVLADAKARGLSSPKERARLVDAAERLERVRRYAEAAEAFSLLGARADVARNLELAGDVERLETLLAAANAEEAREARIRRLVSEHELALALGDRRGARAALREAVAIAPEDAGLRASLRRLEARWPGRPFTLGLGGRRITFVDRLPATLGRSDADLAFRGASVSRTHAEIDRRDGRYVLRDRGSRNGTLVASVPIATEWIIDDGLEVGLGQDVALRFATAVSSLLVEVVRGLDRGRLFVVAGRLGGVARLAVPGVDVQLEMAEDYVALVPTSERALELIPYGASSGRRIRGPVELLRGDVVVVGDTRVEVDPGFGEPSSP